jgi:Tol biopolymer transport system component/DNA-binding beta-propeller fold protein YncE
MKKRVSVRLVICNTARKIWCCWSILAGLALLVFAAVVTGGCAKATPTPEPVSTATALAEKVTASPQLTGTHGPTNTPTATRQPPTLTATPLPPTATPSPTITPTPTPALSEVTLGLPGGDCYGVQAMVADPSSGMLYVLCERTDQGPGHTLIAVDDASGERLATAHLGGARAWSDELQLGLDPEAGRVYVADTDLGALVVLDAATLAEVGRLPGVHQAVPAPGADRFYTLTEEGLAAYRASDLAELAVLPALEVPLSSASYLDLVYNPGNDRLYVEKLGAQLSEQGGRGLGVLVFNGEDLTLDTVVPMSDTLSLEVADSRTNRVYLLQDRQILSIDGTTQAVTAWDVDAIPEPSGWRRLFVDPESSQVHLTIRGSSEPSFWLILDGESLQPVQQVDGLPVWGTVALGPGGHLLAVRRGWQPGEIVLDHDPGTGQVATRLVLGRQVLAAQADPTSGQVYALDSAGGLTVLEGVGLQIIETRPELLGAVHPGLEAREAALELDPQRRRLFVVDRTRGETLALDLDTLNPAGSLALAGPLAVDAGGGRLFIGDEHIYVYDTATLEPVGDEPALRLEGSPDGMYSAPTPEDIVFDRGRLFIRLNSGGVKASFAEVSYTEFDPDSLESLGWMQVEVGTVGHTPVVLPQDGRVWLSYEGHYRQGLGAYAADTVELGLVRGLGGQLMADEEHLFLLRQDSLAVLDPERGYPWGAVPLPAETSGGVLDEANERFYLWGGNRLASIGTAYVLEGAAHPQPGLVPEDAGEKIYPSPNFEEDKTLFAVIPDTLESRFEDGSGSWRPYVGIYRSTDGGETWQHASRGIQHYDSLEGFAFSDEYAQDNTLGVWARNFMRSQDGGDTWAPPFDPDLAFVSDRTGDKEIYAMYYGDDYAPFSLEWQRLTHDPAQDDNPAWSPDGERLVFQSDRNGNNDLWIMNRDGTGLVQLTLDPADDLRPTWSPDGGLIAFTSLRDGSSAGYLIDAPEPGEPGDESSVLWLTDLPAETWFPRWGPEGWEIVFRGDQPGDDPFVIVDRDGRNSSQLPYEEVVGPRDWLRRGSGAFSTIYADSSLSGNSDLYHDYDTGPRTRRLTQDPSDETAPAREPHGPLPYLLRTPLPAPPGPPPTPLPALPPPEALITSENAVSVAKSTCWPLEGTSRVVYAPDGRLLAVDAGESFHLYDTETLERVFSRMAGGPVQDLAFGPSGSLLAVAYDTAIELWDVGDCPEKGTACGQRLATLEGGATSSLAFSPDGRLLIGASPLQLWRVGGCASGAEDCGSLWYLLPGKDQGAFSPDGQFLAATTGVSGPLYRVMGCERPGDLCFEPAGLLQDGRFYADELTWSPDGARLAAIGNLDVYFFDMSGCSTGQEACGAWTQTLELGTTGVTALGPDWTVAASGYDNGRLNLWALADGHDLHSLQADGEVASVAFHPRDAALATVSWGDQDTVCVWRVLPEPRTADREALLYEDDFADVDSGWAVEEDKDYTQGYSDGEYQLAVHRKNYVVWTYAELEEPLDDFSLEVDAHQSHGALTNTLGIVIYQKQGEGIYHFFQITSQGSYSVRRLEGDEWSPVASWTETEAINQGLGADNHLQLIRDGERISFYVNGVLVTDVTGIPQAPVFVGLAAGAYHREGMEARFDNVKVYGLED